MRALYVYRDIDVLSLCARSWGEPCEGAWGGVNIANGQGIMTRAFISGGFSWTGWE